MTVEIRYVTVLYCCAPSPGTKCISHTAGFFHQYGIGAGPFFCLFLQADSERWSIRTLESG